MMNTLEGWDGFPPDRDRDGWHWLRFGELTPAYWSVLEQQWSQGGICCGGSITPSQLTRSVFVGGVDYIAPCIMPDGNKSGE